MNEIILGDCLVEMAKLPDKSVDLVLTDPFYLPANQFDWKMMDDFLHEVSYNRATGPTSG